MKKITGHQLRSAVERAGLPAGTWEKIEAALAAEPESAAAFEAAHVSYYLGALLIIGAMGWFVTSAWDRLSGPAICRDRNRVCAVYSEQQGCGSSALRPPESQAAYWSQLLSA